MTEVIRVQSPNCSAFLCELLCNKNVLTITFFLFHYRYLLLLLFCWVLLGSASCCGGWAWALYLACSDEVLACWHLINLNPKELKVWTWYRATPMEMQNCALLFHVWSHTTCTACKGKKRPMRADTWHWNLCKTVTKFPNLLDQELVSFPSVSTIFKTVELSPLSRACFKKSTGQFSIWKKDIIISSEFFINSEH